MIFEIHSYKGVGPLMFGMNPDQVRDALGAPFKSFKRSPKAPYPCDYFMDLGVFTYYTSDASLEAVEFGAPSHPILGGVDLLSLSFNEARGLVGNWGGVWAIEADGLISNERGVSFFAPNAKDSPELLCESVLVFDQNYWD
ncbi:MAG: ABC transporter ATP-binding protein [Rubrivivax sp.]|nr:MAG: ABC transporter ATP-binding protein [Rubrivivax sp.]